MARRIRSNHRNISGKFRSAPYPSPSFHRVIPKKGELKTTSTSEKKDWKGATCPVCMEYPHNAVLLLCSSHDKGCRPYMCATSHRYSNCLEQFKKAHAKTTAMNANWSWKKSEVTELGCPLCRGQVKGWTVVEPAREYLNQKRRSCTQDECTFNGNYKELRKHVRSSHPRAKPQAVDPVHEQKWRNMENQRERADVISTIRSSMPRSVILGDYVIEMGDSDSDSGFSDFSDEFFSTANGRASNARSIFGVFLREAARRRRHREDTNARVPSIVNHASDGVGEDIEVEGSSLRAVQSEQQHHRHRRRRRGQRGSAHAT
ncbi:uncharacterized protein LOC141815601 [Curcuma longa]|uniref:uncharacterized protein LOC141815601 n=1 Tax=Curcuma longa TaxID=136217 RepID=UPI003D9EFFF4